MGTRVRIMVLAVTMFGLWPFHGFASSVKIGMVVTTSGPQGITGQDQYDGFMLAVDQGGGSLGGVPVEVVKKDDQNKPEIASQLAQELLEKDKVSIMTGVTGSNILMAVYKKIINSQTVFISFLSGPAPIAGAMCSPYFFATYFQNDMISENSGRIATLKGFKRMYLLAPNYQGGKDIIAGFKRFYKGEIVAETYTQLAQPDYSVEIADIRATKPDGVMVFLPGAVGINFVKQYAQAGLQGKVPLISSSTNATLLPAMGDAGLGLLLSSTWEETLDNPVSKKFTAAFEAKYKRPPSAYGAMAYDAAVLLGSALKRTKGNVSDKMALIAAIKAADFKSVRGSFKFNTNHFPIADWSLFEVVKDPKSGKTYFAFRETTLPMHKDSYAEKCSMK